MIFHKLKEFSGHGAGIYSLAYDGAFVYSGSADSYVTRWNLETGEQDPFAIKFDFPVYSIKLINDNNFLVVGLSNGQLHIFDLAQRIEVKFFIQHTKAIFSLAENPEKNQLYATDADGNLSIWDASNFELLVYLPLDAGKIRRISVDHTGDYFSLACQDSTIRIFETSYFNEIKTINGHPGGTTALCFHPVNNELIFTGGKDAHLCLWNWKNETQIQSIPAHNFVIYDCIVLKNKLITASRDKTIKVWDLNSLEIIERLDFKQKAHRHSVNALVQISDHSFASASDDKRILLWDQL